MNDNNDDELISAFLDEQMSQSERQQFQLRLDQDAALRDKLNQFKNVDNAIQLFAEQSIDTKIPKTVDALLEPSSSPSFSFLRPIPIAASLAAIALTFVLLTTQNNPAQDVNIALQQALNSTPSDQTIWLDNEKQVALKISLSFRHQNGQFCREYVLDNAGNASRKIACKQQDWQVLVSSNAESLSSEQLYHAAKGAENKPLDQFIDENIRGDVFDAEQEKTSILKGWQ